MSGRKDKKALHSKVTMLKGEFYPIDIKRLFFRSFFLVLDLSHRTFMIDLIY